MVRKGTKEYSKMRSKAQIKLWKNSDYRKNQSEKHKGKIPGNKLPRKIIYCKNCYNKKEVAITDNHIFCNNKCKYKYQKTGKSNIGFKKGYISWNKNLTKENDIRILNQSKKISLGLRKARKEGKGLWKHTEETKQKIREKRKLQIFTDETKEKMRKSRLKQIFPIKDTKIEVKMKEELEKRNLMKYFKQHKPMFNYWQSDFTNEQHKIIIECDGDYWHNRPEVVKRDKIKNKLAFNNDYYMCRF